MIVMEKVVFKIADYPTDMTIAKNVFQVLKLSWLVSAIFYLLVRHHYALLDF